MDIQALSIAPLEGQKSAAKPAKCEYLWASIFLMALTFAAHGRSLKGSWRWDDGAHLSFAAGFSPWEYFLTPGAAQAFSPANVSPWNALFYDINLSLFGLNTADHYAHLLGLISAGAILFYAVLRQWLPPLSAIVGATTLLLGKPTVHIAAGLMHGHYVTGFVLAMLAIFGWAQFLKGHKRYWLGISICAYALATTCKEIYVPLVVLLPFLPIASWNQRLRALLPFILVAVVYTCWRYWLLGQLLGGYNQGAFNLHNATLQVAQIPELLFGKQIFSAVFLIGSAVLLFTSAVQRRLNWMLIAVTFCIVMLPLLPLTTFPGINSPDRYLFAPWIAFSALLGTLSHSTIPVRSLALLAATTLAGATLLHTQERKTLNPILAYWDTLYRFAISANKSTQAIFVEENGGTDDSYRRHVLTGARETADSLISDAPTGKLHIVDRSGRGLNAAQKKGLQLFEFINEKMQPMSQQRLEENFAEKTERPPPEGVPLEVSLSFQAGMLHWKFGPLNKNYLIRYEGLSGRERRYILKQQGQTAWIESQPIKFSFCLSDIVDDFDMCSPMLEFDFKQKKRISWQGVAHPIFAE
jgi:hypothetical protein